MLEGRSVKNDSYELRIFRLNHQRPVRTAVETLVRENSKDVGLHNKCSRTLIRKSWRQLNVTEGELSTKIDSRGVVQYNDGTLKYLTTSTGNDECGLEDTMRGGFTR